MNDVKLLNVKTLAERWDKDESTIRNYVASGILET